MAKRKPQPDDALAHIAEQLRPLAVAVADLHLDRDNAKHHPQASLDAIAASLRTFGQVKPIVVNRVGNVIIAGNGAYLAAMQLGWHQIAAVFVEHDPATARGYAIADNRTAELGSWIDDVLAAQLEEQSQVAPSLFDELLLGDLVKDHRLKTAEESAAVELKQLPTERPPEMAWVLVGIPMVRYIEIAEHVQAIAANEATRVEMTVSDGN